MNHFLRMLALLLVFYAGFRVRMRALVYAEWFLALHVDFWAVHPEDLGNGAGFCVCTRTGT